MLAELMPQDAETLGLLALMLLHDSRRDACVNQQGELLPLETGLERIDALGSTGELDSYHLFHAARADILRRLRRAREAEAVYQRALSLASNAVGRRYLRCRLAEVALSATEC